MSTSVPSPNKLPVFDKAVVDTLSLWEQAAFIVLQRHGKVIVEPAQGTGGSNA